MAPLSAKVEIEALNHHRKADSSSVRPMGNLPAPAIWSATELPATS